MNVPATKWLLPPTWVIDKKCKTRTAATPPNQLQQLMFRNTEAFQHICQKLEYCSHPYFSSFMIGWLASGVLTSWFYWHCKLYKVKCWPCIQSCINAHLYYLNISLYFILWTFAHPQSIFCTFLDKTVQLFHFKKNRHIFKHFLYIFLHFLL